MRQLPNWLDAFMLYCENSEPPDIYKKWVAVSVICAALRRKCFLNWGYLTFYPNFFIVLVGPPGKCRKGTAMSPGFDLLRDLGIKMAAESITREALIRELKNSNDTQVDPISGKMYLHSSLTIFSPELTVFLGYNNHQLMSDLTDWYDCRERWTYRTKNMGTDDITGVWVNLIGATTPDLIQSTLPLDAIGGGLTSRMIFVYADKKGKIVPAPFLNPKMVGLREQLARDLEQISMLSGEFRVTQKFLDGWIDWYTNAEAHPPFTDPRFAGYVERRPTHIMKLSIVMNAMRTDGNKTVSVDDLESAIALLEETEVMMTQSFGGVGKAKNVDITNKVLAVIAERKEVMRSELLSMFYYDVDSFAMDAVMQTLQMMKAVVPRIQDSGDVKYVYVHKQSINALASKIEQSDGEGFSYGTE